jgi:hypothetical protein
MSGSRRCSAQDVMISRSVTPLDRVGSAGCFFDVAFSFAQVVVSSSKCEFGCYGPGPEACKESPPLVFFSGVPSDNHTTSGLRCTSTLHAECLLKAHIDILLLGIAVVLVLTLFLAWSPSTDGYTPIPRGEAETDQQKQHSYASHDGPITLARPVFTRDDDAPKSDDMTRRQPHEHLRSLESAV